MRAAAHSGLVSSRSHSSLDGNCLRDQLGALYPDVAQQLHGVGPEKQPSMRYLLLDRVLRLERHQSVRAIKNVALSEDIFADHFLGFPVMPGALMIEVVAQAGTVLLEVSEDFQRKALLAMVDRAKFRSMVRPGDQLMVDATLSSINDDVAQVAAEIRVGETVVMDGRLVFSLQPSERFYPQKTRHLVETAYEIWLEDAELIGFP